MVVRPNARVAGKLRSYVVLCNHGDTKDVYEIIGYNGDYTTVTLEKSVGTIFNAIHDDGARRWIYWTDWNKVKRKPLTPDKIDWDEHDWSARPEPEEQGDEETVWEGIYNIVGMLGIYRGVLVWRDVVRRHTMNIATNEFDVPIPKNAVIGFGVMYREGKKGWGLYLENGETVPISVYGNGTWSEGVWVAHEHSITFYPDGDGEAKSIPMEGCDFIYNAEFLDGFAVVAHDSGILEVRDMEGKVLPVGKISYPIIVRNFVFFNDGRDLCVVRVEELLKQKRRG